MSTLPQALEFDPELAVVLPKLPIPKDLNVAMLPAIREGTAKVTNATTAIQGKPVSHREVMIDGPEGTVVLSIFEHSPTTRKSRPGIFYIHGGGRILGNRFSGVGTVLEWVVNYEAVCVSIEYRLAPEFHGMIAVEECYTGIKWMASNVDSLGIHPSQLMIAGQSAGGGLAAGVALLARDRGGPALCAQLLMCPQLDERNNTVSSVQFLDRGIWNGKDNALGWRCALGENTNEGEVSPYLAPARATDLTRLPPAYIDVGSSEVFRDEDVAYAQKLWQCGVQTELHVWAGGYHVFDQMVPMSELARKAVVARSAWVQKHL
ncbi:Alpha/Beta hydrolase protein [Aspergillus cavernicola]|uniref:Alpha/Beta hydrolase protein n=1 Tax=Aspergillus cavernicola TaxID=176166 RepID=A0ABR4I772_9EURO